MSMLIEHAAELRRDHVETRVEVALTRLPAPGPGEPGPQCRACRRAPATFGVVAELVAVNPANQPVEGTLGRIAASLCDACAAGLAPALPPALAAAESTPDCEIDAQAVTGLVRWLGASSTQAEAARVRLVGTPTDEGNPE